MIELEKTSKDTSAVDVTDAKKAELLAYVDSAWSLADDARSRWMKDKEEGLNLYWGLKRPKDFPFRGCANLHVPLVRTMAETIHSNIMGSIDFDKPARIMPVGPEDVPKARKVEKLINWQLTTQIAYHELVDNIVQSVLMYGIAPVMVRYVIEKDGPKKYDGIKVEVIEPERFLTPPDASSADVDEMEYVMREIAMTRSDIKKRILSGAWESIPDEDLDRLGTDLSQTQPGANILENLRGLYSGVDGQGQSVPKTTYATIVESHINFDLNDDGIAESLMVTWLRTPRKILRIRAWKSRRPFVIVRFNPILHKAVGESVADLIGRINQELNTIHNQRVDAVTLQNIPFGFFDPVAGFNPDETHLAPGVMFPTNGSPTQAVYFPSLNITRPEMYKEEENCFEYAERLLGAGANTQGIMESKRSTATEIAVIDKRSGIRFLTIFNRIKRSLSDIFRLVLDFDKEYLPQEIQVRITGFDAQSPVFEIIERKALVAQLDIMVNGRSILDDRAEKQDQFQIYQLGMTNPLIMRDPQAIYELTKDLFLKMDIKRIDAYLKSPSEEIPTTPQEEHNLFLQEEYVEPHLGEDADKHAREHADFINSENFKILSKKGRTLAMRHYAATLRMKESMERLRIVAQLQQVNAAMMRSMNPQMGPQMPMEEGMPTQEMPMQQGGGNGITA